MRKPTKQLRILFTDVGHPVTGGTLKDLRRENENFYFVGVDNTKDTAGFLWVDSFYLVPKPSSPGYIDRLLEVSILEKIDVIVPWTNEEALIIAESSEKFEKRNIRLLNNSKEKIEMVVDKGKMFKNLNKKDFPVPEFRLASSIREIEQSVLELGYPDKAVVVKPRSLSGERGFCIIDRKIELNKRGFGNKLPLKAFLSLLEESGNEGKLNYLVMDFLAGRDYSVDCLCKNGQSIFIIPRTRMDAMGGVSLVGETTNNLKVREQVEKVIKSFDFDYNINVQLKYRRRTEGQPFIYDINPRISGTVVASSGAGINLLYYGIKLALGESIPKKGKLKYWGTKMVRYWEQEFIKSKDRFTP